MHCLNDSKGIKSAFFRLHRGIFEKISQTHSPGCRYRDIWGTAHTNCRCFVSGPRWVGWDDDGSEFASRYVFYPRFWLYFRAKKLRLYYVWHIEPSAILCARQSVLSMDYYTTVAAMFCQKKAMEQAGLGRRQCDLSYDAIQRAVGNGCFSWEKLHQMLHSGGFKVSRWNRVMSDSTVSSVQEVFGAISTQHVFILMRWWEIKKLEICGSRQNMNNMKSDI